MKNFTRENKGTICLGEKVMVSDPCYGLNTWCQGVLENVLPGNYKCTVELSHEDDWGKRVSAIEVCHEDYTDNRGIAPEYDAEPFEVGVDSGQAGIFDYEYYAKYHSDSRNPEHVDADWYEQVGQLTCDEKVGFCGNVIDERGLVSSSGYGDDVYACWTARNPDGKIYSILVEFIVEDEDEDDEIY